MKTILSLLLIVLPLLVFSQEEPLDTAIVSKIRKEGFQNSKVMEIAFQLTDVSGPRLTNSPGYFRAANYAKNQLAEWGLINARLEPSGEFGKGWELQRSYVAMTAPYYKSLIALPRAWTSGTNGMIAADVLLISAKNLTELEKYRGQLKDKILIIEDNITYKPSFEADAVRYTDAKLKQMEITGSLEPIDTIAVKAAPIEQKLSVLPDPAISILNPSLKKMAMEEGAIAILNYYPKGHDGTIFVGGHGGFKKTDLGNFLDIMMTFEDYKSTIRLLKANVPVKMELDIKTAFQTNNLQGYNVIGEIEGTDSQLQDELVMIGAHLDSWHGSTGATDNAAGVAVMMEAVRILRKLNVHPRRTIRIVLWGGEEQGLFGSLAYVRKNFGGPDRHKMLPSHEKVSAYYNLDNGTGRIRGIYLQGNESVRPIFKKWFEPFADMGAKTVTINKTFGTDHDAFNLIGLPGFQFIQDPIDYETRTHHSNVDSYDHLIADDLKSSSIIIASIIYHTAMRDEKLPRK